MLQPKGEQVSRPYVVQVPATVYITIEALDPENAAARVRELAPAIVSIVGQTDNGMPQYGSVFLEKRQGMTITEAFYPEATDATGMDGSNVVSFEPRRYVPRPLDAAEVEALQAANLNDWSIGPPPLSDEDTVSVLKTAAGATIADPAPVPAPVPAIEVIWKHEEIFDGKPDPRPGFWDRVLAALKR